MPTRAVDYARISEDPRQQELGVTRQREDCAKLIGLRGWEHAGSFADNDVSVLRPGAERPGYDALMAAVERGEVDVIVAYGLSRLWRNRRERAEAIEILRRHRVSVSLVKGSDLDLSSAAGRGIAGMMGEFDTMESELKGERVARAALQRAEQGRANGHVAFGWRRVRTRDANGEVIAWHDELDADQAAVVREIVDRLLEAETIKAIVADLNAREVPPPRAALSTANGRSETDGAKARPRVWTPSTLRKIAMRPANAGRVVRGREDFGDAAWPQIVDKDRHARVVALLTDPARTRSRSGARKHMLTYGIGECGRCGAHLRVVRRGGHELYVCDTPAGCVGRRVEWVDELAGQTVIARLARPDAWDLLVRDDSAAIEARDRAAGIRARMAEAADAFAEEKIDIAQLARINERLRPELSSAERDAARAVAGVAPEFVARLAGPEAEARWDALDVAQRRALLTVLGMRVRILPARGGPGFKPESVRIEWV
jgi:DNA invertase Pin-like site-specific DNA recombinase